MIKTLEYIEATSLIPQQWSSDFWMIFSETSEFTWGDNNRSLVTASRFLDEFLRLDVDDFATQEEYDDFVNTLENLGETYIDLEN